MAFSIEDFSAEVLSGLDEGSKQAVITAMKNPTVAKKLEEGYLRQSDYSKKQQELDTLKGKTQDYWNTLDKWKADTEKTYAEKEKLLKHKLIDEGVNLDGAPERDTFTKKEAEDFARQSVAFSLSVNKLGNQYLKDFGEVLDGDELMKIASQHNVNIVQAYDLLVAPKRESVRQADFEKQLAKAREEGKEEAIKNFSLPTNEQPAMPGRDPHALDSITGDKKQFGPSAATQAYLANMRAGKRASGDQF